MCIHISQQSPAFAQHQVGGIADMLISVSGNGLTLFFVLSGFLLYRPFARSFVSSRPRPGYGAFLRNRGLRILPAYWVILLLCAYVFSAVVTRNNGAFALGHPQSPRELIEDLTLVQNLHPGGLGGIAAAWSLTVEACFYLALPFLVAGAAYLVGRCRTDRQRIIAVFSPALFLFALGWGSKILSRVALYDAHDPTGHTSFGWDAVFMHSFPEQADLFAWGVAIAAIAALRERGLIKIGDAWRLPALIVGVGTTLVCAWFEWHQAGFLGSFDYRLYDAIMGFAGATLVACVGLDRTDGRSSRLVRLLEWRPLIFTGLVSYSAFLWHGPLLSWLDSHGHIAAGRGGLLANFALVGVVTGVASFITFRFVEVPALARKARSPMFSGAPVVAEAAP